MSSWRSLGTTPRFVRGIRGQLGFLDEGESDRVKVGEVEGKRCVGIEIGWIERWGRIVGLGRIGLVGRNRRCRLERRYHLVLDRLEGYGHRCRCWEGSIVVVVVVGFACRGCKWKMLVAAVVILGDEREGDFVVKGMVRNAESLMCKAAVDIVVAVVGTVVEEENVVAVEEGTGYDPEMFEAEECRHTLWNKPPTVF